MNKWYILAIIVLGVALGLSIKKYKEMRKQWETAMENVKSYNELLSDSENKSVALKLTVDQLEYYQDSIVKELNATREELKIKDKNLESLQAIQSIFVKTDTITLNDTIFKEPQFALDTLFGDEWYTTALSLKYPSSISVTPTFKSSKHIIVHTKKETVNPPKKFFLLRWFQRKHRVLKVDVVEKNPYVQDEKSEYIEIIK